MLHEKKIVWHSVWLEIKILQFVRQKKVVTTKTVLKWKIKPPPEKKIQNQIQ